MEPQAPILDFVGVANASFRLIVKRDEQDLPVGVFEVSMPGQIVLNALFAISPEDFTFHGAWDGHKLLAASWEALAVTLASAQAKIKAGSDSSRVEELERQLSEVQADRDRLLGRQMGIKLG